MTDRIDRQRALEQLRGVETEISLRVHTLRRWLIADLQRHWDDCGLPGSPPPFLPAERIETWWRDLAPGGAPSLDRNTLDRIPVLEEWLSHVDSAVADAAQPGEAGQPGRAVERYRPDSGDNTPIAPLLERLFLDLWRAQSLRERAGISPS